ncbi:MAG: energy transducer TonB [Cypionkella sp.]|uniref:cell envelope integrity protein TolA n=1 Tax=Cypionkella sp. TaxID=2811411 RepID=UPI002ABB63D3|nr:energy transducer TonB [Cypionkella sp.]MDZ4309065.1 energy transducer TonB [Cypionkella sp.]
MTSYPASVDWVTARAGDQPLAYAAKWAAAATSVAGAMAALVMLTLWLNQGGGSQNGPDTAVMIDMAPLPEAPPAIATLEPAPEVPMAELPETLEPIQQDEPLPDLPEPELAPDLPDPVAALEPQLADLPPDAEAPPEKLQPKPVPEEKPAQKTPEKPKAEKPKAPAKSAQQPVAKQKAASAASKRQVGSLVKKWGGQIRKRVERRKTYPRSAAGIEGIVTVRLTVTPSGGLAGVAVARSSGNATLDAAALQAVSRAGSFPAAPKALTDAHYDFDLDISFTK